MILNKYEINSKQHQQHFIRSEQILTAMEKNRRSHFEYTMRDKLGRTKNKIERKNQSQTVHTLWCFDFFFSRSLKQSHSFDLGMSLEIPHTESAFRCHDTELIIISIVTLCNYRV